MANIQFKIIESTRSAAQSVRAHRFRSFLTTLGIIIGVASVISVVSVLQGFSLYISSQFDGIGTNVINVERYTPPKNRLQGKWSRLTYLDYLKIKEYVPGVSHVTPSVQVWGSQGGVTYRDQSVPTQVFGSASSYQSLNAVYCEDGRFINQSDDDSRRRVAVIGSSVVSELEKPYNVTIFTSSSRHQARKSSKRSEPAMCPAFRVESRLARANRRFPSTIKPIWCGF